MAPSNATKKILEDFIEIYRKQPCLWQMKNKDYHNRDKKEAAYNLLIKKLREIEPDANKDLVVKKINNLRSNVRKEKKKYEQSLKSKSGASGDDMYRIKLWYYDLFNFVYDQRTPRESSSNLVSDDDQNSCERDNTDESSSVDEKYFSNNVFTDNNETRWTPKASKTKRTDESTADEVLESVGNHFKRPRSIVTEDRCDIIGKNVAIKLRGLDAKQIIVAEKLINDLLFEAEMGHLTLEHAYIDMRNVLMQNQQSYDPNQHTTRQYIYQCSPTSEKALPLQNSVYPSQSFQSRYVLKSSRGKQFLLYTVANNCNSGKSVR